VSDGNLSCCHTSKYDVIKHLTCGSAVMSNSKEVSTLTSNVHMNKKSRYAPQSDSNKRLEKLSALVFLHAAGTTPLVNCSQPWASN